MKGLNSGSQLYVGIIWELLQIMDAAPESLEVGSGYWNLKSSPGDSNM